MMTIVATGKLDWEMRMEAGRRLIEWGVVVPAPNKLYGLGDADDPVYTHLAWLLGYEDGEQFMFGFREDDREKLIQLIGPYGLTIYRVMVLRHV